jgi:hypothetical protein
MKIIFITLICILSFRTQAVTDALCPPLFQFDGANCFLAKITNGKPFIHEGGLYHSGSQCQSGFKFDGKNCYFGPIPWNHNAFIHENGLYTDKLPHFIPKYDNCPAGFSFDGANCWFSSMPGSAQLDIKYGHFVFRRQFYQNCSRLRDGAVGLLDPFWCSVGKVPSGYNAFVYERNWYIEPKPGGNIVWYSKNERNDPISKADKLCLDRTVETDYELVWADEFNDVPDNTRCFTSNEILQCNYKAWWGFNDCRDNPNGWRLSDTLRWKNEQIKKYINIRNLNKCRWFVHDSFNQWDSLITDPTKRFGRFSPENIEVRGGVLKMKTTVVKPKAGFSKRGAAFDCGRPISQLPNDGIEYSKNCPYVGALIETARALPWTATNNPNHNDPHKRYVGFAGGLGKYEFRARVSKIGHGGWPSLWMFIDGTDGSGLGAIEIDVLELLADQQGTKSLDGDIHYAHANQTVHRWRGSTSDNIHTSVPVRIGNWYTYSAEWFENEIHFYIDNCLRKIIRNGDKIKNASGQQIEFIMPKQQMVSIIIGNPAAGATWLASWYRAANPTGGPEPRSDFKPTELEVDYVRYYRPRNFAVER